MNTSVIGGGSWGSAFARYLGSIGLPTLLWIREEDIFREVLASRGRTLGRKTSTMTWLMRIKVRLSNPLVRLMTIWSRRRTGAIRV